MIKGEFILTIGSKKEDWTKVVTGNWSEIKAAILEYEKDIEKLKVGEVWESMLHNNTHYFLIKSNRRKAISNSNLLCMINYDDYADAVPNW